VTEFNSLDKIIVDLLIEDETVTLSKIHKIRNFDPIDIFDSLSRLRDEGILTFGESSDVCRAANFNRVVVKLRGRIFNRKLDWKDARRRFGP
jgi:hypothetical protein